MRKWALYVLTESRDLLAAGISGAVCCGALALIILLGIEI